MKESNQKKILLMIIAILVIANTVTCIMLLKKPDHKKTRASRYQTMTSYLKDQVGFNETQIAVYDSVHRLHLKKMEDIMSIMRAEKESRFNELVSQGFNDSSIALAANSMGEKQKSLESAMLGHLREVRAIANEEQKARFDTTFIRHMSKEMKKKQGKKEKR